MTKFIINIIMLGFFGLAGCASSEAPSDNVPATASATEPATESADVDAAEISAGENPDEIICRREQVTGTNFRRRVCLTRAEREAARKDTQDEMLQRRSSGALL